MHSTMSGVRLLPGQRGSSNELLGSENMQIRGGIINGSISELEASNNPYSI